ncbi:F-box protein CPR1-like [Silene latifolia]|uniref:F-box protein CPR1-like n=1 Tax=Silene latifolia TaxID=37657 RepID=UPI003D7848C2
MFMMTQLPIDLITDILSRLPAKCVVCLKIVCKSWCNLISDDYFVNCHLEKSLATKTNLHYVVTTPRFYMQEYDNLPEPRKKTCNVHYSADFDSLGNLRELSHPFKDCRTGTQVFGSCRGLLLLCVTKHQLLLYNPTTQTYNVLPSLRVYQAAETFGHFCYGFGYDNATRDFKCVRIMQRLFKEIGYLLCEVMLYSQKTNCWKRVPDFPCYSLPCDRGVGVFVHETLHWVGTNSNDVYEFIVAFNLRDEAFSCLPLPNFHFKTCRGLHVGTVDGILCLLTNCSFHCHVWVMKEYGVAKPWTRMFKINTRDCLFAERPISYSMDMKRVLVKVACGKLAYLDLKTKKLTVLRLADCDRVLNAHVYIENLLVLNYSQFVDGVHS